MQIITKVSRQKRKGYYNIFLNNSFAFGVSERTLSEYRLLVGVELTDEQIKVIKQFELNDKALQVAINYLSYQPRTVGEIKQYLHKKEVGQEAVENIIIQLTNLGYLDDEKYADLFIKNDLRVGKDGPKTLIFKLTQKGIAKNISEPLIEKIVPEDWIEAGIRLTNSLRNQTGRLTLKEIQRKAKTKLISHGFTSELSDLVIEALDLQEDASERIEALKKQASKAWRRYRNNDEYTRKQKVRRALYQHGFSGSEIDDFLNGEIMDLQDLNSDY
ncbi:recombination regulator RecX [Lactobacillus sp. PV037]|uniref:recombination regulator RecX n=1 Tax=Lactobacillus sp. PV037 TaxID=2594496 RepID=UPI00223EA660|nr:recombination regulator RecX [Lactobacillus sp. PV037]QNQ83285.1 recombination regulator RecX [Lactobacillus sp. PV037]